MPLIIPKKLPAFDALSLENIFVMSKKRAVSQDIRPLKICIVNLMPTKIITETQLSRVLANSPLQVELTFLQMDSHQSKNTSPLHLETFYKTLDEVKNQRFDGMIITGAPVENLEFEKVDYWKELCEIFKYSKQNVYSTVHICWGAQAALYYHYKIKKYPLEKKMFGVFDHDVLDPKNPLMRGFDEVFKAPHSRHTEVKLQDIEAEPKLRVLAKSDQAGVHIAASENCRRIFIFGHQEYDRDTLATEYFRDKDKGFDIQVPHGYFKNDDPSAGVVFNWRSHANLLFSNWLNYIVYQETPYNLDNLKRG